MIKVAPAANSNIGYAVADAIKARKDLFDEGTEVVGFGGGNESDLTFTFEVVVKLKRPMKL
jgi:hypothetical protein